MVRYVVSLLLLYAVVPRAGAQCAKYQLFANDSVGCENDIFSFKVLPQPPKGAKLNWDFGVKKISNNPTPSVAFLKHDTITVSVEMQLAGGGSCQLERKDYLKIGQNPKLKAVVSSDKILCNTDKEATLTATAPGVKKLTWSVEGTIYNTTSKVIKHKFGKPGYTKVQLIGEGVFGCTTKKIFDSVLFVEKKPDVSFPFADTVLCGKTEINLNPTYTYYGQNSYSYSWSFHSANPSNSSAANPPQLEYANQAGKFDIDLSLTSKVTACQYTYNFANIVQVQTAPALQIKSTSLNGNGCKSKKYTVQVVGSGIDPTKVQWYHTHGDSIKLSAKTGDSIVVTGNKVGTYKIFASYPFANCTKVLWVKLSLETGNLVAQMDRKLPCICKIPSQVFVKNRSVHYAGLPMTYNWVLTNEKGKILKNSTDTNFRWGADRYGKFVLSLRATGSDGCSDETSYNFTAKPLKVGFSASPSVACAGSQIAFTLSDTICADKVDSVYWTLFDLKGKVKSRPKGDKSTDKYKDTGWYNAAVVVTTEAGCRDSLYQEDVLHITDLSHIEVKVPKGPFCAGQEVKVLQTVYPKSLVGEWYGILSSPDTTLYTGLVDSIKFTPPLPGVYDLKVAFATKTCADSILLTNAVTAGGVLFDFNPAQLSGCLPFTTTLKSNVLNNVLNTSTDKTVTYEWGLSPQNRGSFADNTVPNAELTVTKLGNIDITLAMENSEGCKTQVTKKSLFSFTLNSDFELPDTFCSNLALPVVNNSRGAIDSLIWQSNPAGMVAKPFDTSYLPNLIFTKPGDYDVALTVFDGGGCSSVKSKKIHITDFGFAFSIDDSSAKCSPASYQFKATGTNIDTFIWKFNDGQAAEATVLEDYLKIIDLTKITPYHNQFNVTLIAKNNIGCIDSVSKSKWLTVLGPVPDFRIVNPKGCAPHEVHFINQSTNARKVYFDFGDNTSIDSVNYLQHTYELSDSSSEVMTYRPFIVVSDDNGCQYSYKTPDTIFVYHQPVASFSTSKFESCDPTEIAFADSSLFAYKWYWYFGDGDSLTDSLSTAKHRYHTGEYTVNLRVENAIGCSKTASNKRKIVIYPIPRVNFRALDTIACVGQQVSFKDSTQADFPLKSWEWDFGLSPEKTDSSHRQNPRFTYTKAGKYAVQLIVSDSNACADTLVKTKVVHVFHRLPVDSPLISRVSVWNDERIEMSFKSSPRFAFVSYTIDDIKQNKRVYFSKKRRDTTLNLSGFKPDSGTYCLRVTLTDICGFTHPGDTHCTVNLQVDTSKKQVATLLWSPYIGWKSKLTQYQVLRGLKDQAVFPIAKTPAQTLGYIDSSVCSEDYIYEVRAINKTDKLTSASNQVGYKPEYVFQVNPLEMYLATVQNEEVKVHWQKSIQRNVDAYIIDRKNNENQWINSWRSTTDTFLTDNKAQTNNYFYHYRVHAIDKCGYESGKSPLSSSILLRAAVNNSRDYSLNWNTYKQWPTGVESYILQRRGRVSESFKTLAILAPGDTSYTDTSAFLLYKDSFSYRVMAVENGMKGDTSVSNIRWVKPLPSLFIPNAFSPNNDGHNDVFLVKSFALLPDSFEGNPYNMQVYNRWGERVFESDKMTIGWDGKFKNEWCEPGRYIYVIKAQGKNGTLYYASNWFVLLR
ncbi:PKD domain-containing protein [bacterium]|nr:PKD domain-containing protein [bacterium]